MENILLGVLFLACIAYLGHTVITINPFSIKLLAWDKLVGILFLIVGFGFLKYYNQRTSYEEGFVKGYKIALDEQTTDQVQVDEEKRDFYMYLYRGNTKEVREKLEDCGILPLSSPKEGGYLLVAGNRYSVIEDIDEFIPELYDCSDSLDLFLEKCKKSQK